jgi:carbonic anhydrase
LDAIDQLLEAARAHAAGYLHGDAHARPARRLLIVACMDARLHIEQIFGLGPGDAHILRNAGGIVTEDVLRSIVVSQQLLGTRGVMIINHTDCGMLTFKDEELRERLRRETGAAAVAPSCFHAFSSLEENVREQIQKVHSHPWIAGETMVRGFIYDVRTGGLEEVTGVGRAPRP